MIDTLPESVRVLVRLPVADNEEILVYREEPQGVHEAEFVVSRRNHVTGVDKVLERVWTSLAAARRAVRLAQQIDDDDLKRVLGDTACVANREREYQETLGHIACACRGRRIVDVRPSVLEPGVRFDETAVVVALEDGGELRFGDEGPGNRFALVDRLGRALEAGCSGGYATSDP